MREETTESRGQIPTGADRYPNQSQIFSPFLSSDLIRCAAKNNWIPRLRRLIGGLGAGANSMRLHIGFKPPPPPLPLRHQSWSLEIRPAKPSLRWPLQRTGSVSEGQAFFPSKFRRVAIITSSSVSLWQASSKGSLIPLGTTCDERVRMRKPLFSRNATAALNWRV